MTRLEMLHPAGLVKIGMRKIPKVIFLASLYCTQNLTFPVHARTQYVDAISPPQKHACMLQHLTAPDSRPYSLHHAYNVPHGQSDYEASEPEHANGNEDDLLQNSTKTTSLRKRKA